MSRRLDRVADFKMACESKHSEVNSGGMRYHNRDSSKIDLVDKVNALTITSIYQLLISVIYIGHGEQENIAINSISFL